MSQERAKAQSGRDLLDRLLVRAPILARSLAKGVQRVRPGTSLRRRVISVQARRGFAAMARSDIEVVLLSYDPEAEVWMRSMAGVGMSDCYRGHQGVRKLYADVDDAFEPWWWTLRAIADRGSQIAVRGDFVGYGRGSGAKTTITDGGTALKLSSRGVIVWQEWFVEQGGWRKALEVVGLSE